MPVSLSLATAPIAPAQSASIGACSLPWIVSSCPIRSLAWVWLLSSVESDVSVAGEHAQQVDLAAERVGDRLEHVGERAGAADLGHVARPSRRRQTLDDQVEQAVRADVAGRRAAADREELALGDELLERRRHLLAA